MKFRIVNSANLRTRACSVKGSTGVSKTPSASSTLVGSTPAPNRVVFYFLLGRLSTKSFAHPSLYSPFIPYTRKSARKTVNKIYLIHPEKPVKSVPPLITATFCRGAEIRTRTKSSQRIRATVTLHPEYSLAYHSRGIYKGHFSVL